nr:type II toxin-antitoxin system PemK/MazF family toxin [arsenite-oxidising bacterium NT-25]CAD6605899.1 type II toxin-antitoxin system PemK/MazF family toxin [Rhizobium sp. TCK]
MLLVSATIVEAPLIRVTVHPSAANRLRKISQVMVDKAMSVKRDKLGPTFGRLEDESMLAVNRSLAVFLNIL